MGIAFGGNSSLDIDRIVAVLSEIYDVPKPNWRYGEFAQFIIPAEIIFPCIKSYENKYIWLEETIFHEFGHYLFHVSMTESHKILKGMPEGVAWERMKKYLVENPIITAPLHMAEEGFVEEFAKAVRESFEQLKPEYKKMFGLM